jgi:hypothetical protein
MLFFVITGLDAVIFARSLTLSRRIYTLLKVSTFWTAVLALWFGWLAPLGLAPHRLAPVWILVSTVNNGLNTASAQMLWHALIDPADHNNDWRATIEWIVPQRDPAKFPKDVYIRSMVYNINAQHITHHAYQHILPSEIQAKSETEISPRLRAEGGIIGRNEEDADGIRRLETWNLDVLSRDLPRLVEALEAGPAGAPMAPSHL